MISNVCISHFVYYEKSKTKKIKQAANSLIYPFLIMKDETSLWFNNYYWNFLILVFLHLTFFSFFTNFLFDSTWAHGTTQPIDDTCWAVHTRPKFFESWFHETSKKEIDFFLPENLFLSLASITGYFIAVLSLFCLLNLIFVTAGGES